MATTTNTTGKIYTFQGAALTLPVEFAYYEDANLDMLVATGQLTTAEWAMEMCTRRGILAHLVRQAQNSLAALAHLAGSMPAPVAVPDVAFV